MTSNTITPLNMASRYGESQGFSHGFQQEQSQPNLASEANSPLASRSTSELEASISLDTPVKIQPVETDPNEPVPTEPISGEPQPSEPNGTGETAKQVASVIWNANLMQTYYNSQTSAMENYMYPDKEESTDQSVSSLSIADQYVALLKLRRELSPEQQTNYSLYDQSASQSTTQLADSNSIVSITV